MTQAPIDNSTSESPAAPDEDTREEQKLSPTFTELGVRAEIVQALAEQGIERTFAIQELTLPIALGGDDLIGQARTGMGKTYGFGVPLLERITSDTSGLTALDGTPRALVVVPTRELAKQVHDDLSAAAVHLPGSGKQGKLSVVAIYGGKAFDEQIDALESGADVVVGTPGRLLDLAQQGKLILGMVAVFVLDEADEMLDLGFLPDIERIAAMVPDQRQTMLFSATMPGPIITLARRFMTQPTHIRAELATSSAIHERTEQFVYRAHSLDKPELVARVLQADGRGATMIFTRTKRTAQKVADDLIERGFKAGAVHGDLGQVAREKALKAFRNHDIDVLVATDVAARGIDIDDVTHVINYQSPDDENTYVHRIGRTGRAGRTGVAITLVDWDDIPRWQLIDKVLELGRPEPVETYSTSAHLREDLGIPEDATGRVGKPVVRHVDTADVKRTKADAKSAAERSRGNRTRRRTRGAGAGSTRPAADAPTAATGAPSEGGSAATGESASKPRRRRRRGRGHGSAGAGAAAAPSPQQ